VLHGLCDHLILIGREEIQLVRPDGCSFTTPYQGGNPAADSHAEIATGKGEAVTRAAGEANPTIGAGLKGGNPNEMQVPGA
jgi:hypothetical protein